MSLCARPVLLAPRFLESGGRMSTVYYVPNWEEHFESAKSKGYKNKSQAYMPNKQGLGYKRLLAHKSGPAMFGAWCALIQSLSRQVERQGYLTDTGLPDGRPWTAEDVALITLMPPAICAEMLEFCSNHGVDWIAKDTVVSPQSPDRDTSGISKPVYVGEGKGKGKGKGEGEGRSGSKPPRERDHIIDAIALTENTDLAQVTGPAWSRYAKAKQIIMQACPDVTPDEIKRRAQNWGEHFRDATYTANALATHWGRLDAEKKRPARKQVADDEYL